MTGGVIKNRDKLWHEACYKLSLIKSYIGLNKFGSWSRSGYDQNPGFIQTAREKGITMIEVRIILNVLEDKLLAAIVASTNFKRRASNARFLFTGLRTI